MNDHSEASGAPSFDVSDNVESASYEESQPAETRTFEQIAEASAIPESQIGADPDTRPVAHRRHREADDWLSGIQWLCSTVVLAVFVITFIAQAFQIPSESMENTLLIGDYLLVDKVHYGTGGAWNWLMPYSPIHHGDIIVFRYPVHPSEHFVKRVIGIPGDHVRLFRGTVFVNGKAIDDSHYAVHKDGQIDSYRDNFPDGNYISPDVNSSWWIEMHNVVHHGEVVVPPDKYFVLGDNRDKSLDSRYWGFVPRENIIGRPFLIYWSVERPETVASDGKLGSLLYTLAHLPEDARWDRTMRLVR